MTMTGNGSQVAANHRGRIAWYATDPGDGLVKRDLGGDKGWVAYNPVDAYHTSLITPRLDRCDAVPVEEIGRVSAHAGEPRRAGEIPDGLVLAGRGRRDDQVIRTRGGGDPLDHAEEERPAGEREERLPGKPARPRTGLDHHHGAHDQRTTAAGAKRESTEGRMRGARARAGMPRTSRQTPAMFSAAQWFCSGSRRRSSSRSK